MRVPGHVHVMISRRGGSWQAAPRPAKVHRCATHLALPISHDLILYLQLPEDVALFVEHVLLLVLCVLALEELLFVQLGLAILTFKLLPELGVVRVALPLLSQLFYILVEKICVVLLLQLRLELLPLDARLGCACAKDPREVRDGSRLGTSDIDILGGEAVRADVTIASLGAPHYVHLDLRDCEFFGLGQGVGTGAIATLPVPQ